MFWAGVYRAILTVSILCAAHVNARADFLVFANTSSNMGSGLPPQQASSGTVADGAVNSLGDDYTEARVSARHGQLRSFGYASSGPNRAYFGVYAINSAFFRDDFLIDSNGRTGTAGTVEVKFTIDGTLAAMRTSNNPNYMSGYDDSVRAQASYTFQAGTNGPVYTLTQGVRTAEYAAGMGNSSRFEGTPFLGIEQTVIVPFTYGTKLEGVKLQIDTIAQSVGDRSGFSSMAMADLEHTANWGGFGAVRDSSGNVINDYSFTSGSGFNYTIAVNAVPEPGSIILGTLGCVGVLFRRRLSKLCC